MLFQAIVQFFRHKVAASIIVLSCWSVVDKVRLMHHLSEHGVFVKFSCNVSDLDYFERFRLQGVLYFSDGNDENGAFAKVKQNHFMSNYKWLIVGDRIPKELSGIRYDADIAFLKTDESPNRKRINNETAVSTNTFDFSDVYVHPRNGVSLHPWAVWSNHSGFQTIYDRERILRRLDMRRYPLSIATPTGHFSNNKYNGTFMEYLKDESLLLQDTSIRSAWMSSVLLTEAVNAQDVLIATELWSETTNNKSMYVMVSSGVADLSGAVLRILLQRTYALDFIVPIWPFRVGFTYLAERESSSNMYLEPFSPAVWWMSLAIMVLLALVQRMTSKSQMEKDGAFYNVLTTWLQQDASAVPNGPSGRWAFIVLSVCAMLVHAYYTSAIVSALMSTGRGGPNTLVALADSKYEIACEDIEYMRYLLFGVNTNWEDLEYLKRKKMTSKFYTELERGAELIEQGSTAFHSEYMQIFPHFKTWTDDKICKLQYLDTIAENLAWVTSSKDSQWTSVLRIAGAWIYETGLAKRLVTRLWIPRPVCKASLLAERVNLADVAPLLILTLFGGILSVLLLAVEITVAKINRKNRLTLFSSDNVNQMESFQNDSFE